MNNRAHFDSAPTPLNPQTCIQHGQAPSSQSTDRSSKLPSIALGPGVSGYRSDMDARPKRTPPTAARGKPPAGRGPAASSAVASAPAVAAGDAVDLKNYVSDELRKVLEEEEVGMGCTELNEEWKMMCIAYCIATECEGSLKVCKWQIWHGELKVDHVFLGTPIGMN